MLLAVDTSTQWMGLALYDGVQVLGELAWRTQTHHTVELAPSLQDLLARTHSRPADLEALGVALGPGSFTSLRIGLALVKGLALALRLPVVGIPTLDVVATSQPLVEMPMAAVLEVGRGRLAVGWYALNHHRWVAQGDPDVMTANELSDQINSPTLIVGELNETTRQLLGRKRKNAVLASPAQSLRQPAYLAELAWKRYKAGRIDDVNSLSPIYLRTASPIPG